MTEPLGQDFAVVVGLNSYPAFEPLAGAEGDITDFAAWLREVGVPAANLSVVLGSEYDGVQTAEGGRPNVSDIERHFRALLQRGRVSGRLGRRLYIVLAGHGFAPDIDSAALLTAEATVEELGYHIPGREVANAMARSGSFDEVVLIMDCCRDAVPGIAARPLFWSIGHAEVDHVRQAACFAGPFGAGSSEGFIDEVQGFRGLFSRAVLKGLKGWAAATNGSVTVTSLRDFVEYYLPTIGGTSGFKGPRFHFDSKRDITLVDHVSPILISVSIEVQQWPPVEVRNYRHERIEGELNGDHWQAMLPPGLYEIRQTDGVRMAMTFEVLGPQALTTSLISRGDRASAV